MGLLAIFGPNGGGKTTLFRALLNLMRYTGSIKWNGEVRMGYVPQSLVCTDLPILVEEFLRFKCRTDFETWINSVGLEIIVSLSKRSREHPHKYVTLNAGTGGMYDLYAKYYR
jgi:ABC-type multidrug transport system ATPase subunit